MDDEVLLVGGYEELMDSLLPVPAPPDPEEASAGS